MAQMTLSGLSQQLAQGHTTSRALVEAALAAIADPAREGSRAFLTVDAEGARAAADHIDRLRQRGRAPSPLAGIPFSVKDLFDLAGEVTTAGSKVLKEASPAVADAPAIARLKQAGLIVLGRTNMTEFAYSGVGLNPHYGTPLSPYDRATGRIPGGSSSGAAVAVADGQCALSIGTDTGGSCRIPASYCGITGYKPSAGVVPTAGGAYPLSATLDSVGPLANSVACCAAAHAIMAGEKWAPPAPRPAATLRLAVLRDYVLDGLEDTVAADFDAALTALAGAGATLSDMAFPQLRDLPAINSKGGILAAEAHQVHRRLMAARGGDYDPRVLRRIELAKDTCAADYLDHCAARREMIAQFVERCAGLDAVILPTTLNTPPAVAALASDQDYLRYNFMSLRNTTVGNFLNGCALSLPMSKPGGAPTGLMLIAPWGGDRALLAAAAGVEAVLGR